MHNSGSISTASKDILGMTYLKGSIPAKDFRRFKELLGNACIPIHISDDSGRLPANVFITPATGYPPSELGLPTSIAKHASEISEGASERDLLVVYSAGYLGQDASLLVKTIKTSKVLSLVGSTFEEIAAMKAFPLETFSLLTFEDQGKRIMLISESGRAIDSFVLTSGNGDTVWSQWIINELGPVWSASNPEYVCSMVETENFKGLFTTLAVLNSSLKTKDVYSIERNLAFSDAVVLDKEHISEFLRSRRGEILPQLWTSLVVLGYREWGGSFLGLVDK